MPFAKDSGDEPSYLCVAQVDGELSLMQGHMDGDNECWDLDSFLDGLSRGGFRVDCRWEDQPDSIIENFVEALGLPEQEWETEDD